MNSEHANSPSNLSLSSYLNKLLRFSEAGCETKSLREESELVGAGGGRRNEQISQWLEESRFTQEQFVHVQVLL